MIRQQPVISIHNGGDLILSLSHFEVNVLEVSLYKDTSLHGATYWYTVESYICTNTL